MKLPLGNGTFFHGRQDGKLVVSKEQDVEAIIEHNKALATHNDGYSPSRELRRAASIPMVVVELWRNEYGVDIFDPNHADGVKRLLNSSEWAFLRTAPGRL